MVEMALVLGVVFAGIVAHELAHVAATRAVGHEIFEIQIGGGPLWRFRAGTIDVGIGVIPLGGHVQTGARSGDGFRWRSGVVAISGVAANLALAGIGLLTGFAFLAGFNLVAVIANLWPGGRRRLGVASSDGRLLLDLLRDDEDAIAEERSGWFCMRAMRARDAGDLVAAAGFVEQGVAEAGETRALLAVAGVVAFEQRRFEEVVHAYAALIGDDRVSIPGRAGFAADAAWAALLTDDPELRALAEPWAAFARRVRPHAPRRRMIHALAQVEAGRPAEALETLASLDDASASAVRVLALAGTASVDDARAVYDERVANAMEPDHPLAVRAAAAVGRDGRADATGA